MLQVNAAFYVLVICLLYYYYFVPNVDNSYLTIHRNNPNVLRHELKGFEAPEFMLQKMRSVLSSTKIIVQNKEGLQSNVSLQNNSLIAVASSSPETNTIQVSCCILLVIRVDNLVTLY